MAETQESTGEQTGAETETDNEENEELGESGTKALEAFKDRARRAEREAKRATARIAELENAGKTETQKLADAAKSAEERAVKAESSALRASVGVAKKLDPKLWPRLQGSTRDELEDDADELLGTMRPSSSGPEPRQEGAAGSTMNDMIRQKARR